MRAIPALLFAVLSLSLAACTTVQQNDLQSALQRWKSPSSYRFTFNWGCFCPPDYTSPVVVTVKSGAVVSAIDVATGVARDTANYETIDGLFRIIQDAIDRGADQIQAQYDATTGVPLHVSIDYEKQVADEERAFTVKDFATIP